MAKINLKRGLTDIVLYLIIFIVVQIIVMYAGAGIWAGIKGEGYQATLLAISSGSNPILMALTSAFSNVIFVVIDRADQHLRRSFRISFRSGNIFEDRFK